MSYNSVKLSISIKEGGVLLIFLFYTLYIPFFNNGVIEYKGIFSYILLSSIFLTSKQVASYILKNCVAKDFDLAIKSISFFYLILGVVSVFIRPEFLNYHNYIKSSFPFSEPSHYVITCIPFFIYTVLSSKRFIMFVYLSLMLFLSWKFPSVIMIAATILTLFLILLRAKYNYIMYMFLFLFLSLASKYVIDLGMADYFVSRLNFSLENKNLTALVYIQGWGDLITNLRNTNGIGLGFQLMGTNEPTEWNKVIYNISGEYKNISDGSFLASKLISEFGLIGVGLLLMYAKLAVECLIKISSELKKNIHNPILLFSSISIVSFSIELFLRGIGYFSSSVVVFLISVNLIRKFSWEKSE